MSRLRIIFLRHGEPNYELDCLTDAGKEQAALAAERLMEEGIDEIYASPQGRAMETASYTAKALSLPITQLPFMREIKWGHTDGGELPFGGHPWNLIDATVKEGAPLCNTEWDKEYPFSVNIATEHFKKVAAELDGFLETLGYTREGDCYRVSREGDLTILIASHGGSSSAAIAHLLGMPPTLLFGIYHPKFTSVSVITVEGGFGELACPRIDLLGDAHHLDKDKPNNNIYG